MLDFQKKIMMSESITDNTKYYWGYQFNLAKDYLVDYLKKINAFKKSDKIIEIGCGEGGVLDAFVLAGASNALGTDIVEQRLERAREICKIGEIHIEFVNHDVINEEPLNNWLDTYNLGFLRDVIEHLDDTYTALSNIKKIIKSGGYLFVTFPPYYYPFGGHQHTLGNFWGKIPYIHILPDFVFHRLIKSGRDCDIDEVKRLQSIKLTTKKFEDAASKAGYVIAHSDFYLLRPVFKMKFGLPSIKLTFLKKFPLIKRFFILEAAYLLKKII